MFTISEALPYMDEFVPGLLARFVGATPEQIQALEDEVEHELPETYREFLRVMGVDPGPLFWTMGGAMGMRHRIGRLKSACVTSNERARCDH